MARLVTWVTTGRAAHILDCSVSTIRRWCQRGRLRSAKVGHIVLVRRTDVEALAGGLKKQQARADGRAACMGGDR